MRGLLTLVIVMGVLIVAGALVIGVTLVHRLGAVATPALGTRSHGSGPAPRYADRRRIQPGQSPGPHPCAAAARTAL